LSFCISLFLSVIAEGTSFASRGADYHYNAGYREASEASCSGSSWPAGSRREAPALLVLDNACPNQAFIHVEDEVIRGHLTGRLRAVRKPVV
jgi:hypothetical protein